jgi:hypothetical protein
MDMSTWTKMVSNYLVDIEKVLSLNPQPDNEMALRTTVDRFLKNTINKINSKIDLLHEKPTDRKRPDWTMKGEDAFYGFIEQKNLQISNELNQIVVTANIQQLKDYAQTLIDDKPRIFLTDGIDFLLFNKEDILSYNGTKYEHLSLIDKRPNNDEKLSNQKIKTNVLIAFKNLLNQPGLIGIKSEDLFEELADFTLKISSTILEILSDSISGSKSLAILKPISELKNLLSHFSEGRLDDKKLFSDYVAEIIVFSLLYAHQNLEEEEEKAGTEKNPRDRFNHINDFWQIHPVSNVPLNHEIIKIIWELTTKVPSKLTTVVDDCKNFLARSATKNKKLINLDYHQLFEKYFTKIDILQTKKSRKITKISNKKAFGLYITPLELTTWMVKASFYISEVVLKCNIFKKSNKLIDPACGTGIFLEILMDECSKPTPIQKEHPVLIGIEIQPVPHALAGHRLRITAKKPGYSGDINIILGDTLSDNFITLPKLPKHPTAYQIKACNYISNVKNLVDKPLVLVIGNPPATDAAQGKTAKSRKTNRVEIEKLIEDWRLNSPRNNNFARAVKNEWSLFLRWGCERLGDDSGIIAFVVPETIVESVSFINARLWFIRNFDKVWVLDLDKDGKREGVNNNNHLFSGVRQGRVVIIAARESKPQESTPKNATIYYKNISDLCRKSKITELNKLCSSPHGPLDSFKSLPVGPAWSIVNYCFRTWKNFDASSYENFWPISDDRLAPTSGTNKVFFCKTLGGNKLSPVALFVCADKNNLIARTEYISKVDSHTKEFFYDLDQIKNKWFEDNKKIIGKLQNQAFRKNLGKTLKGNKVWKYSYRPFVVMNCLKQIKILTQGRSNGSGYRPKPGLNKKFLKGSIGLAVSGGTRELSETLHQFTSFCWYPPDNDLAARTNSFICLDQNVHSDLCTYFSEVKKYITEKKITKYKDNQIAVFYAYAILSSKRLLNKFSGAYFTTSNPLYRPRIPVIDEPNIAAEIVKLGYKLACCEKPNFSPKKLINLKINFALSRNPDEFLEDLSSPEKGPSNLTKFQVERKKGLVILYCGTNKFEIADIPIAVLKTRISGYYVIDQWLKQRKFSLLHRNLKVKDIQNFKVLITLLKRRLKYIRKLDLIMTNQIVNFPTNLFF